jgi:hypothetical protein
LSVRWFMPVSPYSSLFALFSEATSKYSTIGKGAQRSLEIW